MSRYEFTLILEGPDVLGDEAMDALFAAGCDDATFGSVDGSPFADFRRDAPSLADAVGTATRAVEGAVPGVRVIRIEPEDVVSAADIAARTGRSRESVRLLIAGERGPGSFPAPISHLRARVRHWRWVDVAAWFSDALGEDVPRSDEAVFFAAMNDALDLRRMAGRLERPDEREEVAKIARESAALYRTSRRTR